MTLLNIPRWMKSWNRKIHIYLGLYMLFFFWLFSVSGLFLNHVDWFQGQKPNPEEWTRSIRPPSTRDEVEQARVLMKQLRLRGELLMGPPAPRDGHLFFRVFDLRHLVNVDADLVSSEAKIRIVHRRLPQFLADLHTFTGVRRAWSEPFPPVRDWWLTRLWSLSIDAIAVGLLVVLLTALYMWYQLKKKRRLGLIVLATGVICCAFFLWGLRWMF